MRQAFHIDRRTHCYLIEIISQSLHPKVFLSSRFVQFANSMYTCKKQSVRLSANLYKHDNRTVFGKNLTAISKSCNIPVDCLTPQKVKSDMKFFQVPPEEKWRESMIHYYS